MRKSASGLSALKFAAAAAAVLEILSIPAQAATCSLGGTPLSTWSYGGSNFNWNNAGNWNLPGIPNSNTNDVCIVDGTSTVLLNMNADVQNLQLASGNTLSVQPLIRMQAYGNTILNDGLIAINGGANIVLTNTGNTILSGSGAPVAGTVTLNTDAGGNNAQLTNSGTLHNVNNTIQGEGAIFNQSATLANETGGTINANSTGGTLATTLLVQYGTVNNTGLMEASNKGTLDFFTATVNNNGGTIAVAGPDASVRLRGSTTIQGGTLDNTGGGFMGTTAVNTATLDGSTSAGPLTVKGTYTAEAGGVSNTNLYGSIVNQGNLQVNGGGGSANTYLNSSGNVTLTGGGTVTLNTISGGGSAWLYNNGSATLDNIDNTIQGEGIIHNQSATLANETGGTINANSTGGTLATTLTLEYGTVTNAGLMEAGNKGTLDLYNTTVNNSGGTIAVSGLDASVRLRNTTIQGGTLDNKGGGFLGTTAGSNAYLDGRATSSGSLTVKGTYTAEAGGVSNTTLYGTIANQGNLQVNGGGGSANTYVYTSGNVRLSGGGTVTLNTTAGGGNAWLYNNGGSNLDNVNNTIQGQGIIHNQSAALANETGGTINANSTGGTLATALTVEYGTVTNAGLMEASNKGTLDLYNATVNNSGGTIAVAGPDASVRLRGTTIQGGTLDNTGGGFMGTAAGSTAYLDGRATSSGPLTVKGTYTAEAGGVSNTTLYGTIANQGNLQINGGGGSANTYVYTSGNVTLTGGGTVTLNTTSGGGNAWLYNNGGNTLDNVNNTIQGQGVLFNQSATLVNEAGGTILANSSGAPLTSTLDIQYGAVTNNGTMQANSGNSLHLSNVVSFTNFSGNTLTGGSYVVSGAPSSAGTLQIDPLGNSGGEIVNNAAKITLNGQNSNFVDRSSLDALSNLAANATADSSLAITGGRNFTTVGAFSNAGLMNIGAGSTFSVGASGTLVYTQTGGTTVVNGTLDAGTLNIQGGMLDGKGMISGSVVNAATLAPGNSPGLLTINGDYTQASQGTLDIELGGHNMGVDFDKLMINGLANLAGTLSLNLINGFLPNVGDIFTILGFTGGHNGMFDTITGLNFSPNRYFVAQWNADNLTLVTEGSGGVPEPSTLWLLGGGMFASRQLRRSIAKRLAK